MSIILVVMSSVGAVDVNFLKLARIFICIADLENVRSIVVHSSIGTMRGLLGKAEVVIADFMFSGLITHIFLVVYINLMLSLEDPDSLIAAQTALTLGVLATLIPLLMRQHTRLFIFR